MGIRCVGKRMGLNMVGAWWVAGFGGKKGRLTQGNGRQAAGEGRKSGRKEGRREWREVEREGRKEGRIQTN